jgi:hypothetical protein
LMAIAKSTTGVFHHARGNATACNGRSLNVARFVDIKTIEAANEKSFCKKCFNINSRDASRKDNAIFIHHADADREAAK